VEMSSILETDSEAAATRRRGEGESFGNVCGSWIIPIKSVRNLPL